MEKNKELTPMMELIELIPNAYEIKQFISENDADEKMLDEWLFERMFKGKNWIEKEKQVIDDACNNTQKFLIGKDDVNIGDIYYKTKYTN